MDKVRNEATRRRTGAEPGNPTPLKVAAFAVAATGLVAFLAFWALDASQSRFVRAGRGSLVVLTEKTAPRGYRGSGSLALVDAAAGWVESATGVSPLADGRRLTLILTHGGFGGIDIADPLVKARFSGPDGTARLPLRRYAAALRGGELAFPAFASPDGAYAAVDLSAGEPLPATVHALTHVGLGAARPKGARDLVDPSSAAFDAGEAARWRFLDESLALLAAELAAAGGDARAAAARFDQAAARYGPGGPVEAEELIRLAVSGSLEDKDAAYFRAAYGFSARLLAVAGIDAALRLLGGLLAGDWPDLESALGSLPGGFTPSEIDAALAASG